MKEDRTDSKLPETKPPTLGWGTLKMTEIPPEFKTQKFRKTRGWKEEITEEMDIVTRRKWSGEWEEKTENWKVVTLTKDFVCPYCGETYTKRRRAVYKNGRIHELERGDNRYDKMHNMYACGLGKRKDEYSITTARTCHNCKERTEKQEEVRRSQSRWRYVCKLHHCEVATGDGWGSGKPEVCPQHCFNDEEWKDGERVKIERKAKR